MRFTERKAWIVESDLNIIERSVVFNEDTGKPLFYKTQEDGYAEMAYLLSFGAKVFTTREEAVRFQQERINFLKDNVKTVRDYIKAMDRVDEELVKVDKAEYLGVYACERVSYYEDYNSERGYSQKLETFIRSGMLNIGGYMIRKDTVTSIRWACEDGAGIDEYDLWKATLYLTDGDNVHTDCAEEVRLVRAVFGDYNGDCFDIEKDE